ncbi:MAG: FliM/FliN family flagellar motor switch protein [Pseudomonadota bacterium]
MSEDVIDNPEDAEAEALLSDDEKDALMAGVDAGLIDNEGDDHALLDIRPYEIRPDAFINYGSYPRLQSICQEMAKRIAAQWTTLLRGPVSVNAEETYAATYSSVTKDVPAPVVTNLITMDPLPGHAIVIVENALLRLLVERFFGYSPDPDENAAETDPAVRQQFTAGELRVCDLAVERLLPSVAPSWEKTQALTASIKGREFDPTVGVGLQPKDEVIVCRFQVQTEAREGFLNWILPFNQIADIADELEGAENARADDGDPHWRQCIASHIAKTEIAASVSVGSIRLPLRRVISLQPGELLDLDDPELASLYVQGQRRALGRFGTHEERNAFRLGEWLP